MTAIPTNEKMSALVASICDTRASPSLIRKKALPTLRLVDVQPIRACMKAARDTTFRGKSVIRFTVKIKTHKTNAISRVAPKFLTKMIFNNALSNKKNIIIETKRRKVIPITAHAVPIITSFEGKNAVQFSDIIMTSPVRTIKSNSLVCGMAKAQTILPKRKAPALLQTEEVGVYKVRATPTKNDGNQLSVSKEITKTFSFDRFIF